MLPLQKGLSNHETCHKFIGQKEARHPACLYHAGRIVSPQFGVGHWPMSAVFLLGKI